jgi:hypothetical protein
MAPESQTLFSMSLFLALSSLLAWSNRRNRAALRLHGAMPASQVRDEESDKAA